MVWQTEILIELSETRDRADGQVCGIWYIFVVFMVWIMTQQVAESKRSQTVRWIGNNELHVERSGCNPTEVMLCCWRGRYGNLSECGQSHGCRDSWIERRNLTGSTVPWDFVVFPLVLRVTAKLLELYLGLVYYIAILY